MDQGEVQRIRESLGDKGASPDEVIQAMALGAAIHAVIQEEIPWIGGAALGVAIGAWLDAMPEKARAGSLATVVNAAKEMAGLK
jgi:hypothetical protein